MINVLFNLIAFTFIVKICYLYALCSINICSNTAVMFEQLEDADNTLRDTVKEKEVIETNLMKKSLELEQRDLILKEKTKIAELREELVTTLKSKEQNQEVCVQKLKAAIMVKVVTALLCTDYNVCGKSK